MPTPEKVATVEKAREWYKKSLGVVFTDYRGLTVSEMQALRRTLRHAGAEFRVVKNTLLRLAIGEEIQKWPLEFHSGPTAAAFVMGDESVCAKALVTFAKEHRALQIKGAFLEGRILGPQEFLQYSQLPSRQDLLAAIAGLVVAPIQSIAGVASELLAGPVRVIAAVAEKASSA
ncbi:MAG: 50S ribosomal protein L10 [Candidatus Caldarchaeum sp.]